MLTDEQQNYILFNELVDTKLIATAGSGKTFTIINKITNLINNKIYDADQILMLTFSRFTKDDFINRINKNNITIIHENNIRTIDSFAKSIIDSNNEVDVSILSYKFMKYLEHTPIEIIKQNKNINNIKILFVDEAQDLNETQYKILCLLKEKNNTLINLIGDPNQNIYQFRGSSDKYLSQYDAKTFYLTYNFRSHQEVVDFSKYLRPNQNTDIICKKKKINKLPLSIFYKDENDLEENIICFLENAKKRNIDMCDFAILAPTRGRMRANGKSNGLCLISNILYKNKYKFKQFYEESTEDNSGNGNIQYIPESGYINILTFMGSKGLEWKYTILIDVETCLINKKHFTYEKHNDDQYLLYVACSRAINNLFIFSKYFQRNYEIIFNFNPWFALIPKSNYIGDTRFTNLFKFQDIKETLCLLNEKGIYKILDKISEESLYKLAILCDYGIENSKSVKKIEFLYDYDSNSELNANMFVSKFLKELFFIYYNLCNDLPIKKFTDIESIINLNMNTNNFTPKFMNWYYNNKNLTWEDFDKNKENYDQEIINIIDNNFLRTKELHEHIIIQDCYFKTFILSQINEIKDNYEKYLICKDPIKIRKYLFKMLIIIYSLETQHYYHVLNNGTKFKYILKDYNDVFNNMYLFLKQNKLFIKKNNIQINKQNFYGIVDFICDKNYFYDLKCYDVTLKNIIHQTVCQILYYDNIEDKNIYLNFINLINGKKTKIILDLSINKQLEILNLLKNK